MKLEAEAEAEAETEIEALMPACAIYFSVLPIIAEAAVD